MMTCRLIFSSDPSPLEDEQYRFGIDRSNGVAPVSGHVGLSNRLVRRCGLLAQLHRDVLAVESLGSLSRASGIPGCNIPDLAVSAEARECDPSFELYRSYRCHVACRYLGTGETCCDRAD